MDAADIDDDLPDLTDQMAQMASEVALELQQVCPPASPSDQAAFDRCRRSLFGDSVLRRGLAPRLLWGRRNQDAGAALQNTNLTQFAPDVIAGLYLSLFMYSGEYSTEYVERERLYLIRLQAGFRNLLPPGQFPYPFWHEEAKWGVYQATNSVLLWVYRTLALRMRDAQCDDCHVPNNPMPMRRLLLMHTPAHAAGEIARLLKAVRADRMPLDDAGNEQPLEPALKRALLESGAAFEELVKAAKDWETVHRD